MFNAFRNDVKLFLQRVRAHSNEIIDHNLPLWRSLLELFYIYLLLSLIVDILQIISVDPGEFQDIVSLAIDARYLQLSWWDVLIAFLGPDYQVIEEAAGLHQVSVPQFMHEHVRYATMMLGKFGTLHLLFSQKWYLKN